jgi:hypothetical protein
MGNKISKEQIRIAELYESRTVSSKEFCTMHNVKYHSLRYWLKKLAPEKETKGRFIPVEIASKSRMGWLVVRNTKGIEVVINEQVSVDFIKSLLD